MTNITPGGVGRPLTPQEKKQYLMNKYTKRDYKITDLIPKYAVYFNPAIDKIKEWTLLSVADSREDALKEILWRKSYTTYKDGDLVLDNDPQFSTWRNELLNVDPNGNPYEPGEELMKVDYNSSGNMLQVIANSAPQESSKNGFKGIAAYTGIEIGNYQGYYKIEEIYQI